MTELEPLLGSEVVASRAGSTEGWALVFAQRAVVPGEQLTIPAGEEVKIGWRLTGEGDVSFRAIGPEGDVQVLTSGPEKRVSEDLGHDGLPLWDWMACWPVGS